MWNTIQKVCSKFLKCNSVVLEIVQFIIIHNYIYIIRQSGPQGARYIHVYISYVNMVPGGADIYIIRQYGRGGATHNVQM